MRTERQMAGSYRGWDRRREREEAVTVNLPPELLPLWDRTKSGFQGSPHQRLEQFSRYAEEHPDEAVAAVERVSDRKLAKLLTEAESFEFGFNVPGTKRGKPSKAECWVMVQAYRRRCRERKTRHGRTR